MPEFSEIEKLLKSKFGKGETFKLKGDTYTILESGKPKPSSGECKTDLYILASNNKKNKEFKISIKKSDYSFLENKMSKEKAELFFGLSWSKIISNASLSIKSLFANNELIKYSNKGKSYTIILGWKIDIFKNTTRKLRVSLNLSNKQKIDVFSGANSSTVKKNALVNGIRITDSGVADYILEVNNENQILNLDLNSIINLLKPIASYAINIPNINFGFTALNYISKNDKWDGDRPLAVWVDWKLKNNKLFGKIKFKKPLTKGGTEVGDNLVKLLESLGIKKYPIQSNDLIINVEKFQIKVT